MNVLRLLLPWTVLSSLALAQSPASLERAELLYYLDAAGMKTKVTTPAEWELRKKDILAGMQKVMGDFPPASKRVPLDVKIVEEKKLATHLRRKLTYVSEAGHRVPAYLLLPLTLPAGKKTPAVLCLHQTTQFGKGEPAGAGTQSNLHYALHLAERGFITFAPDYPNFGEHKWDFKGNHGYVSGTMKAIWDNTRAVDYLQSLAEVDGERIGCIGHSLGGHNTLFTAAFEPRLKVLVSSCGFTSFVKDDMPSWTGLTYMPRIRTVYGNDAKKMPFDFPEIVGTLAPRPFLACAAMHDADFEVSGVKDCLNAARPVYELFGKAANLKGYYPDCKHDFPADARKVAYEFLEKHLQLK